ncbi:sensor histidine kinase [Herbiconiux sp. SYSU D00978]|uniref:sensor histidine kinase n=1 Tax=Herbiconiux sp. SYSU D00978 TaxID=2812562 RepID=UPI001A96E17A|nr:ATP-binding protein [Herbiconiux sp. SYSU D00978]
MSWRFMAALVAVALLAILVQDIPLAGYLRQVERERLLTSLERDAFVLAGRSEEALHETDPDADGAVTEVARLYRNAGGARVVVVDRDGTAIVTSDDDAATVGDSYLSRPEIAAALAGEVAVGTRHSDSLREDLLYVAVPVLSGSDILGVVRLTYPAAVVDAAVDRKLSVIGIVGATTVLSAAVIALLLARSITARLRLLREATERLAGGDRTARAEETAGPPEIRSLARSFNGMAERLEALIEEQRAFAGDASHQLRTPLTALRLRLERAGQLAATDPAGAVARLEAAQDELDRLSDLVEGLLMLSRAEGTPSTQQVIELRAAVRQRAEQWSALAEERGLSVVVDAPWEFRVLAAPGAVEQIVDNLVDNALGASPVGGTVTVRVEHEGDRFALHVEDEGPGMSTEQRARAFERFWRADGSRPGSGLGLAIVEQLARASGATVELLPRRGGGLDAVVRFVAVSAPRHPVAEAQLVQ